MGSKIKDPMKFAYLVPNVSGGFVVSKIPQRTDWGLQYNIRQAKIAEDAGFEYAMTQIRFMGSYGAEYQHDALIFSTALLANTEKINIITNILPGMFHPGVIAKHGATADQIFNGRWAICVVSGWYRREYDALGIPWLDHDERYMRSREFIEILRGAWSQDEFSYTGKYWQIDEYTLKPKPLVIPGRPMPEIFQGGNSSAAQRMAAAVSDWYYMNGYPLDEYKEQINNVNKMAAAKGRRVKFIAHGFVIARETEAEAKAELDRIIQNADMEAIEEFRIAVKEAGQSTKDGKGMWAKSTSRDLVQYSDAFKTNLIGTPEQIAERIHELHKIGVDAIICTFLHFHEETRFFGERVIPLVRELESAASVKRALNG